MTKNDKGTNSSPGFSGDKLLDRPNKFHILICSGSIDLENIVRVPLIDCLHQFATGCSNYIATSHSEPLLGPHCVVSHLAQYTQWFDNWLRLQAAAVCSHQSEYNNVQHIIMTAFTKQPLVSSAI